MRFIYFYDSVYVHRQVFCNLLKNNWGQKFYRNILYMFYFNYLSSNKQIH